MEKERGEQSISGCTEAGLLRYDRPPADSIPLRGVFKNFNTIEEFRDTEAKKKLFNEVADSVSLAAI